jgi:hypothetical protein
MRRENFTQDTTTLGVRTYCRRPRPRCRCCCCCCLNNNNNNGGVWCRARSSVVMVETNHVSSRPIFFFNLYQRKRKKDREKKKERKEFLKREKTKKGKERQKERDVKRLLFKVSFFSFVFFWWEKK